MKMWVVRLYAVIPFLLIVEISFATETYQHVADSNHGFAVSVPAVQWDRLGNDDARFDAVAGIVGRPGVIALALIHKDQSLPASMVVTIESGAVGIPLTEGGLRDELLQMSFPAGFDARITTAEFTKIDGYNAIKLNLKINLANLPGSQRQWHYILPAGSNTFHLLFTTEEARFTEMEPTFKEVIDSFQWTGGPLIKLGSGTIFNNALRNGLIGGSIPLALGALVLLWRKLFPPSVTPCFANAQVISDNRKAELREAYSQLSTDRLEELASNPPDLVPGAIELLREELKHRRPIEKGAKIPPQA
jgi:hypothetical protein